MLHLRRASAVLMLFAFLASGCGAQRTAQPPASGAPSVPGAPSPTPGGTNPPVAPAGFGDTTAYSGYFLYSTTDGHPAVFSLADGKAVWTSPDTAGDPCWSVDGQYVVFAAASGSGADLRVDLVYQSPFAGTERRMPLDPAMFSPEHPGGSCRLSATGDYVAIDAANNVDGYCFVADARTGETVYVVGGYGMFWGPSGNTLCEEYCSEGLPISQEPGMWFELNLTDIPSGDSRSILKGAPDMDILARGFADAETVIYEEHDAKAPASGWTIRDTAGKTYAASPFEPAEVPAAVGTLTTCSGPDHGLWLLADQDPEQVIWLHEPATKSTIKAVAGRGPQWRPGH